ncbi:MAG: hypothetical protein ABI333_09105 [bacterium]
MNRLLPLLIVALLFGGCTQKTNPEHGAVPSRAAMAMTPTGGSARPMPVATPPTRDEVCGNLKKEFRKVLATATRKCKTDADCGSYSPFVNCGGVVDLPTAEKLAVIRKDAWTAKCGWGIACAARRRAEPRCSRGRCFADRSGGRPPRLNDDPLKNDPLK